MFHSTQNFLLKILTFYLYICKIFCNLIIVFSVKYFIINYLFVKYLVYTLQIKNNKVKVNNKSTPVNMFYFFLLNIKQTSRFLSDITNHLKNIIHSTSEYNLKVFQKV